MAWAWADGAVAEGPEAWGTPEGPSPEVEDFAAYLDLCAEEAGLDQAIGIVSEPLTETGPVIESAA